jgi:tRNA U34 5-carboxymethylaminomethyl modifying GTPase MnmE/TrmE
MKCPASIKTTAVLFALLCLMASGDATTPLTLVAQETDSQETTEEPTPPKTRRKPRGRVPNHYGKIGLTDAQKEAIYAIQAKYREQIEALQEQINELQQEEASEIYLVLTQNQKEALKKILEEVAERRKKE